MRREDSLETPSLARASASLFASDVVAALTYLAFALLVARLAGPSARGAVAFVTALPVLLGYGSTLGLEASNLFHAGSEPESRPTLVTTSIVAGFAAGSFLAVVAWGVFALRPDWVPGPVSNGLLEAGLAVTGFMTVQIALDAALIGCGEVRWANRIRVVTPIAAVALFGMAAAVTGDAGGVEAVFAWVTSRVVGAGLAVGVSARRIGVSSLRRARAAAPRLLRYGLPAHVGSLANLPIRRFDTLMLGASRGVTELGVYTAAVNGAEVMFYLPTSVSSVLLPAAASLDGSEARRLTRRVLMLVVALTCAAAVLVLVTAPFLVRLLFGDAFDGSVTPLRILAIALIGASIRIVLQTGLMARRKQGLASAMTVLTLAAVVALDLVLIPRYGAVGAAAASAGAYWLGAAFMYVAFRRAMPLEDERSRLSEDVRAAASMVTSLLRRRQPQPDARGPRPLPLHDLPEEPLVSVLVSSYQYGEYLGDALDSVLAQTYGRFEIVVCDDGSTDDSVAVIEAYAVKDPRVVAIVKDNGGQASALNAAFAGCRGDIVCFLDADDAIDERRLEKLVETFRERRSGAVVHPIGVYGEDWTALYTLPVGYRPEEGWIAERVAARGGRWAVAAGGGIAFRREVGETLFPIPEGPFKGADADAFLFTLLPLLTDVARVDESLYRYRLHGANEGLLRALDGPSVERRLRYIEKTTTAVNARLGELDPPRPPLELSGNLGYEEQRFFVDAFSPEPGRRSLFGRLRRLARGILADDVYTTSRKAGLLLLYASATLAPGHVRPRAISWIRRLSYRAGSLLRPSWAAPALLVPLAALLSMFALGRESFFLDEVASVAFARLETPGLLDVLVRTEANSGLYFLLLHPWLAFGEGEMAVRSLSVVFAVAAAPLLYLLASRLLGRSYGVVAGLLMVVNAYYVRFAQQARGYSLVLLLVIAATYLFVLARERGTTVRWAFYAVVMAAGAYAHFFGLFVLAAHAVAASFEPSRERRKAFGAFAAAVVLIAPLVAFAITRDSGQLSWIPHPSPVDVPIVMSLLAGGRTGAGGGVLLVCYAALSSVALWGALRRWGTAPDRRTTVLLVAWVAVPVLGSFAVSIVKPIFQFNYLIVALPGLVLLAATGLSMLRGRGVAIVLLLVLLVTGGRELSVQYSETNNEEWDEVAAYVTARAVPGDGIAFMAPYVRLPFGYYAERLGAEPFIPEPVIRGFAWDRSSTESDLLSNDLAIYPRPADDALTKVPGASHPRVWLVLSSAEDDQTEAIVESLQRSYDLVSRREFVDVDVLLYERFGPALGR